jgi:hypothetical protein
VATQTRTAMRAIPRSTIRIHIIPAVRGATRVSDRVPPGEGDLL